MTALPDATLPDRNLADLNLADPAFSDPTLSPGHAPPATRHHARHMILDDFLPATAAEALMTQIVAAEARFTPARLRRQGDRPLDTDYRSSLRLPGRVGVVLDDLLAAIDGHTDAMCAAIGIQPFPVHRRECSIVAHRDGDFYKRHTDTGAPLDGHVRVVSCVYYLHRRPRAFSGGALAIHPLAGDAPPVVIEPVHNRLAVFASFIPHEVMPTRCAGGFADSRFSINCWLRRQVRPAS